MSRCLEVLSPWGTWRSVVCGGCFLAVATIALPLTAQPFAIEPVGFASVTGTSSCAGFGIAGSWVGWGGERMRGGAFSLTGECRTALEVPLLAYGAQLVNGDFEESAGVVPSDAAGMVAFWPPLPAQNLFPYGDAEGLPAADGQVRVPIPGWTVEGDLTVIRWDTPGGWPLSSDPGPPNRGANLFVGGPVEGFSRATTRIPITVSAERIDAGGLGVELSGWFGGWSSQEDTAFLRARFLDAGGLELGTFRIGGFTAAQRGNRTGLLPGSAVRDVPPQTRQVEAILEMQREQVGGWNDGYADNLSLVLRNPAADSIPGWRVIESDVAWVSNENALGLRSPFGEHFLDLTGLRDRPPFGGVEQTLYTLPNESYVLSFALGVYQDLPAYRGPVQMEVRVDSASRIFTFEPEGRGNQWGMFSLPFTATSATTRLALVGKDSAGGGYLGLDRIAVVRAGAEPPSAPRISILAHPNHPSQALLVFGSESGRRYRMETTLDPSAGPWTAWDGAEQVGTGGTLSVVVALKAGESARFFRLRVAP